MIVVLIVRPTARRQGIGFAVVVIGLLSPWVVRNALVADYVGFSSAMGDSLQRFGAAELVSQQTHRAAEDVRLEMDATVAAMSFSTPGEAARYRRRQAIETVRQSPWAYTKIHLSQSLVSLLPAATDVLEVANITSAQRGTLAVLHDRGLWAATQHYFQGDWRALSLAAPLVLLALLRGLGVAVGVARRPVSAAAWLMVAVAVTAILAGGPAATPRFRMPIEPILSIGAAIGVMAIVRQVFFRTTPGR